MQDPIHNPNFASIENDVMRFCLDGDDPHLTVFREQFRRAGLLSREFTGVGFFTHFSIPADVPKVASKITPEFFRYPLVEINGVKHGVDFAIFVTDGKLDFLEGFTFDDPWPTEITHYRFVPC